MRYRIRQVWASRSSRLGKLLWNWPRLDIRHDFLVVVPFFFLLGSDGGFVLFFLHLLFFSFFSVVFRCRFPSPCHSFILGIVGLFSH